MIRAAGVHRIEPAGCPHRLFLDRQRRPTVRPERPSETCRAKTCNAATRGDPRKVAGGLDGPLFDGAPLPDAARAVAAARGFAAGTGYLTGQIIDRAL
jgi:hypothetical protein